MDTLRSGGLLAREQLGSTCVYRVVDVRERLVEVEVVAAPGMAPGARVHITRVAAQAMRPLERPAGAAGGAGRRGRPLRRLALG